MSRPVGSKNKPKEAPAGAPENVAVAAEMAETNAPVEFDSDGLTPGYQAPPRFDGNDTADQAAVLEAKDEAAAATPAFPLTSFDDIIASLQAGGEWELAEHLIKQKAESDRWQQHEEDMVASQVELTAEVVDAGSEEDPFKATEPFFRPYTVQDVKDMVIGALVGKAEAWEEEARAESMRGAGSPATVATLKWGAGQLRDVAGAVSHLGDGEWVEPEVDAEEP